MCVDWGSGVSSLWVEGLDPRNNITYRPVVLGVEHWRVLGHNWFHGGEIESDRASEVDTGLGWALPALPPQDLSDQDHAGRARGAPLLEDGTWQGPSCDISGSAQGQLTSTGGIRKLVPVILCVTLNGWGSTLCDFAVPLSLLGEEGSWGHWVHRVPCVALLGATCTWKLETSWLQTGSEATSVSVGRTQHFCSAALDSPPLVASQPRPPLPHLLPPPPRAGDAS